jgi:hypothetical protein
LVTVARDYSVAHTCNVLRNHLLLAAWIGAVGVGIKLAFSMGVRRAIFLVAMIACGGQVDSTVPSQQGECHDEIIATESNGASALALDGDEVFWGTMEGYVRSRTMTYALENTPIIGMAVDKTFVYWTIANHVRRVLRAGGPAEDFAAAGMTPVGLELSNGSACWAAYQDGVFTSAGQGTSSIYGGVDMPSALTSDDHALYVTGMIVSAQDSFNGIVRIDKSSLSVSKLVDMEFSSGAFEFGGRVYFLGAANDPYMSVMSVSSSGGSPQKEIDALEMNAGFDAIAVDESGIYATVLGTQRLALVRKHDGHVQELASADVVPPALTRWPSVRTSATAVYWAVDWTYGTDSPSVRKVCKR